MANFNIWQPQGLLAGFGATSFAPNVIYEANAQILSGTVFKMWYSPTNLGGLSYAESTDGLTWSQYSGNPLISDASCIYSRVYKHGSTYYLYTCPTSSQTQIDAYTSTDGIAWTLAKSAAITPTAGWELGAVVQLNVLTVDGTGKWWGYYAGGPDLSNLFLGGFMGLATSTDGINWTKGPSNPVISIATTNFCWTVLGGTLYYGWSATIVPGDPPTGSPFFKTDLFRFFSGNPAGPWTQGNFPSYYSATAAELSTNGLNISAGDPSMVAANGNLYLYYTNTAAGHATGVACAIASSTTLTQLVETQEGVLNAPIAFPQANGSVTASPNFTNIASDTFTVGDTNWTLVGGSGAWGGSLVFSTGNVRPGSLSINSSAVYNTGVWPNDQWSQVTYKTTTGVSVVGVMVRATASGGATPTYYHFYWFPSSALGASGTWALQKYISGAEHDIATGTMTMNVGDVITLAAVGTNLYVYWNGYLFVAASDSSIASGSPGIVLQSNTAVADAQISAWSGGSFQAAAPVAFSISGNAGQAGATVYWVEQTSFFGGSVTADGSGNYTIPDLVNGSYSVSSALVGFAFSATQIATVSSANVTGINFTASAIVALTFTQLAADPLNGSNLNPLNPTNWTTATGFQALKILSNVCQVTTVPGENAEAYTGIAFPVDQYAEAKVASLTADTISTIFLGILCNANLSLGEFLSFDNEGGGNLFLSVVTGADVPLFEAIVPFSIGDVFRIAAIGTQIIIYQNGTQIAGTVDASRPASGSPVLALDALTTGTDATVTHFAAGATPSSFSISGNAGHASATVSYSGTASGSVTADGSGNYTISGLATGSYTITPALAGFTFSPASRNETYAGSNITGVNFTATPNAPSRGYAMIPIPTLLQPGQNGYFFGSYSANKPNPLFEVTATAGDGTTATLNVVQREGFKPAVGDLINVSGTTQGSGGFNLSNVALTAVSLDAVTGVGTLSYLCTASASVAPDFGEAIVINGEVPAVLANGASAAVAIQTAAGQNDNGKNIAWASSFPTAPIAVTLALQGALTDNDSDYQTIASTNSITGDNIVISNVTQRFYRVLASGVSGAATVISKITI